MPLLHNVLQMASQRASLIAKAAVACALCDIHSLPNSEGPQSLPSTLELSSNIT